MDLINQANNQGQQQPQFTQNITNVRSKLTEQRISPHDLVEFDAESYKEMKNQGLTIDQMKERTHKQYEKDDVNFDVAFMAPKKENYSKKPVFLPEKGQKYNSLTNNVKFKKALGNFIPKVQQTYVNSQPKQYGFTQNVTRTVNTQPNVGFTQNVTRTVNAQPNVGYTTTTSRVSTNVGDGVRTSKTVKRVYKNQYGEVVNVEEQKYY